MEKVKLLRTWFIVFLSAAVVFGGLHAYATYRASQDVDRVLQKVRLKHLAVIPVASSGLRYLRVYLEVENPAYNPVTVSLSDIKSVADGEPMSDLTWLDSPRATLEPGETVEFVGQTNIWESTYAKFQAKEDEVLFAFNGEIAAAAKCLWVETANDQALRLSQRALFD